MGEAELRDLTNDGQPEVIVSVSLADPYHNEYGLIYTCRNSEYGAAVLLYGSWISGFVSYIERMDDFNANGLPELLVANMTIGANDIGYRYGILEWDGQDFIGRIDPSWRYGAWMHNGIARTEDTDGDGRSELILRGGTDSGLSTCGEILRQRTDIWEWNGEYYVRSSSVLDPPTYRFESAVDGDYAFFHRWTDRAVEAYQSTIFDDALEPSNYVAPGPGFCGIEGDYYREVEGFSPLEERAILEAYSRFRLVQLHGLDGNDSTAQALLTTLQERFQPGTPGAEFSDLAELFLNVLRQERQTALACEQLLKAADTQLQGLPDAVSKVATEVSYLPTNLRFPHDRYLCPFQ